MYTVKNSSRVQSRQRHAPNACRSCHYWLKCQRFSVVNSKSFRLDSHNSQSHGSASSVMDQSAQSTSLLCALLSAGFIALGHGD
eukprot:1273003-Amphidinium_carterae.6